MSFSQSDFDGRVFERHPFSHQQHGVRAFDPSDRHGSRAHPLAQLVMFLVGKQNDQSGFSTSHSHLMGSGIAG